MFLGDLLKVLRPIAVEADLFLAKFIESLRIGLYGRVKASLVRRVVLVSRLDDLFMVVCVLDVEITRKLVRLTHYGAGRDRSTLGWRLSILY